MAHKQAKKFHSIESDSSSSDESRRHNCTACSSRKSHRFNESEDKSDIRPEIPHYKSYQRNKEESKCKHCDQRKVTSHNSNTGISLIQRKKEKAEWEKFDIDDVSKPHSSYREPPKKEILYKETAKPDPTKGKKFIVTFSSGKEHHWAEYSKCKESIWINGRNGPVLHLYRGNSYFFHVEQNISDTQDLLHLFVLTDSPYGGPNSRIIQGGFAPVSKGCVCLVVDKDTPRYFFYQDSKNEAIGGLVIVHD